MRISDWSSDVCSSDLLVASSSHGELADLGAAPDKPMRLRWVQLLDNEGRPRSNISRTEGLTARICYDINAPIRDVHVVCHIPDLEDRVVLSTGDCDEIGRASCRERVCRYV